MDRACADCPTPPLPVRWETLPYARWLSLAGLLVVEMLFLGLRFDSSTLDGDSRWWAELLGNAGLVPQVEIVVAAMTLVLGGPRLRSALRELSGQLSHPSTQADRSVWADRRVCP